MDRRAAENEIRGRESALYRAMIGKDFAALEQILSAELVYIHSTAVAESKKEYLAGVAKGLYEYESVASRAVRVAIYGDVAVMHGVVDMSVSAAGQPKELTHLRFALIWVRQAGAWRLALRQATRIPAGGT